MHKEKRNCAKSTCELYYKCKDCCQTVNMNKHKKAHKCNEQYCKTCKDFFEDDHQCYMQPEENEADDNSKQNKSDEKSVKYIFFDFESTQDDRLECELGYLPGDNNVCVNCKKYWCGSFEHKPNLCVVHKVCQACMSRDINPESECLCCGKNERVFSGSNTTETFCKWLFAEENVGATVICHNFKGYDSYPILQYLHRNAISPEVITSGSKYMSIKIPVCKMRFIDSLNFIPMALAGMPKAFGESKLAKGYFPHMFNRKENQRAFLEHLPDLKYYHPDGMKPEARKMFLSWYGEHKNDKRNFLDYESIGLTPPQGYRPREKQSIMAYQWLAYLAEKNNISIQHGRNMGEKQIGPYKVDGYYETEHGEQVVLEFHGDFWHGCPKKPTINPVTDMTMGVYNFQDISTYGGLIKCKIIPPRGLYIPVLPVKCNGKLLFSLCRTCTESYQQTSCEHDQSERAFTGTWVLDEVKEALRQGYEIERIYEIWHFDTVSQYDSASKTGGIFTAYVNTFLRVKQEASDWPEWCNTENDKQKYIQQYYEKEGILLEYENIKKNPGLRSLAKLVLNSFWGKLGQRTNLTRTSYVTDPDKFFDFMTSDQQEIKSVRFVNDESVQIDWAYEDNFMESSCRTNVVIAAYTTAQARLKLYSYLQPLGRRVLYCDTDSVIFTICPGAWQPRLRVYLGDLTDEVSGSTITNFVTGGPKNYAYKTKTTDENEYMSFCKVRGVTLNFKNSLEINYDIVANMVTVAAQQQPAVAKEPVATLPPAAVQHLVANPTAVVAQQLAVDPQSAIVRQPADGGSKNARKRSEMTCTNAIFRTCPR
ncbi:hypothetical protein ScPMuIL_013238 [Solemya velum]